MSRINELLAELCPNGVSYTALSEVAAYSDTRIDATELDETNFVGVDNLVSDKGGKTDASYLPNTARLTGYRACDVLLGNIRPYLKKVWLATNTGGCSGDVLAIRISSTHRHAIVPLFLYYLLSSDGFFAYNMQHAKGAKMPRGDKVAILNYRIPVPPLEVQREIVRILDQFTQLEAELEAELEARRRQYDYYRDSLLTSQEGGGVQRVPMGELGKFIRGRRFVKSDVVDEGIPAIHYGEIYTRYGVSTTAVDMRLRPELGPMLRYAQTGDVVIVDVGETVEDVGKAVAWLGNEDVAIHDHSFAFRHAQNPSFVSYYLQSRVFQREKAKYVARTKVKTLSMPGIAKICIPVPSLVEQERVVAILDKFDSLVNDLSVGLPAELAARRRQYEHYRDRLLTFKEAS